MKNKNEENNKKEKYEKPKVLTKRKKGKIMGKTVLQL